MGGRIHTAGMIQGFRGREGGYTQQGLSRVLVGGRIHTAGMIPGFSGREDTHSRDDPVF